MDFEQIRKDTELKDALKSLETTRKRSQSFIKTIKSIERLKRTMERLKRAITEIDVPRDVTIRRETDFSDITRRFLIWHFAIFDLYQLANNLHRANSEKDFQELIKIINTLNRKWKNGL